MSTFFVFTFISHAQDTTTCDKGFTPIQDAVGLTCIPEASQRIVALEWTYVEDLLALGIQPVGVADIEGYHEWVKIPVALDESVVDIGTRDEPNLEQIAALNPDFIIGVQFRLAENYDDLSAIAPTLVFNPYPANVSVSQYDEMTTTFKAIAMALGKTAEAEAILANVQTTYDGARASLEAAGRADESFILSQGWMYDNIATFRLFTDNAMAVQILEQIGLTNAWDDAPQLYGFTEISIEGFADLKDQDFNFLYVAQNSDNDFFNSSPIWSSLKFVQNDQAYWMGGDVWLFGGPLSAQLLVETVLNQMGIEILTPTAEATANP
ncbi:MAG: iron-siderophore ABC transporter substrate-binding protein [Chloroflexi bacterium]|nr:iron-siderophore ABC transporter substrate-binding protein [Chloroflexota bacterium]MCC6891818.1 iron-siderophore ABC transporter substrate-binding protein [Anaerolineae bacterium]